jgi:chromosomal replication initiator protein
MTVLFKREQQIEMFSPAEVAPPPGAMRETAAGAGQVSLAQIIAAVALETGVSERDMKAPRRDRPVVRARHLAMYLARQLTDKSLPVIGRCFGGRDHTTALGGVRKMTGLVASDAQVQALARDCTRRALNLTQKEKIR